MVSYQHQNMLHIKLAEDRRLHPILFNNIKKGASPRDIYYLMMVHRQKVSTQTRTQIRAAATVFVTVIDHFGPKRKDEHGVWDKDKCTLARINFSPIHRILFSGSQEVLSRFD